MKPIRILHIVSSMNLGGIETLLMSIYREIDRNKVQFDFLVHRSEKGFFDDEIIKLGGEIHHIQPLNPIKYFIYRKQLKLFFNSNKQYSIVHSHLNENSSFILAIAKKCGVKHRIAHSHIDQLGGAYTFIKTIIKKHINKVSTKRFACSKQAGLWLYENAEFSVFNNAINTNNFIFKSIIRDTLRNELKIDSKTFVIGHIGSFKKQKNHVFIVDVFYYYLKLNPKSRLLLIGSGNLMPAIKQKAETLKVLDKIIFTGAIGNANDYLNVMDLFLLPSLYEGLGIVAVEAQANGLPILMSDNLPNELNITDLPKRLNLNIGADKWANEINNMINENKPRKGYEKYILKSGYDINASANYLEGFYQSLK